MEIEKTEQALIGAIIASPDLLANVSSIVTVSDFTNQHAALVYSTVFDMWREGVQVDTMTVITRVKDCMAYIAESGGVGYNIHAIQYARDIAEVAKVRRLYKGFADVDFNGTSSEIIESMVDLYNKEATAGKKDSSIASIMDRFDMCVAENKKRGNLGVDTGFDFLYDKMIQYAPGHIWTIGGYTSTGKTATMVEKLSRLFKSNRGVNVCVISTEMTEEQLVARLIGNMTGIYSQRILVGDFMRGEEEAYTSAKEFVSGLNLHVYEDVFTLSEIETAARKHNLRDGLDVMFIDYVQNCHVPSAKSEYQEQAIMAKSIQKLAKDVSATIVCLSQVSNDVGRGNTDNFELKGAGEWAAVSDVGIMLQRSKVNDRALKYEVKKNRHGAKTEQVFEYNQNFTRLEEADEYITP